MGKIVNACTLLCKSEAFLDLLTLVPLLALLVLLLSLLVLLAINGFKKIKIICVGFDIPMKIMKKCQYLPVF